MQIDWTLKITDLVMIVALFVGPIAAVQITEYLRSTKDSQKRKEHIFRTLMATRSSSLSYAHIEALNLVEIEFNSSIPKEKKVIDCWRLYIAHLNAKNYPMDIWQTKRGELLIDLLYEISTLLGYAHDKAQIQSGAYYPQGYVNVENDNAETRQLWLEVLRGKRQIPMKAEVVAFLPPSQSVPSVQALPPSQSLPPPSSPPSQ